MNAEKGSEDCSLTAFQGPEEGLANVEYSRIVKNLKVINYIEHENGHLNIFVATVVMFWQEMGKLEQRE